MQDFNSIFLFLTDFSSILIKNNMKYPKNPFFLMKIEYKTIFLRCVVQKIWTPCFYLVTWLFWIVPSSLPVHFQTQLLMLFWILVRKAFERDPTWVYSDINHIQYNVSARMLYPWWCYSCTHVILNMIYVRIHPSWVSFESLSYKDSESH